MFNLKNKLVTSLFIVSLFINSIFVFSKDNTIRDKNESINLLKPSNSIMEAKIKEAYGNLPLSFEINKGQLDSNVKFLSKGKGYTLFLTENGATFSLLEDNHNIKTVKMHLDESKKAEIIGEEEFPGKSNYFVGNDSTKWTTNISQYRKIRYKEVYAGVDLVYYGTQKNIEYDFIVKPGAKTEDIKMNYDGVDKIFINKEGELVLKVGNQEIKQHRPYVYQEKEGQKTKIAGRYEVKGQDVGFKIENYDLSQPLVIDPVLDYSSYIGSNNSDESFGIALDSSGAVYITGYSVSINSPSQTLSSNAFVTKLKPFTGPNIILDYSTYIGGDLIDQAKGIAVDQSGNAYVTGYTLSTNFPIKNEKQKNLLGTTDAFVTKLDTQGAIIYSTYLGGTEEDWGHSIAVDSKGAAYVTGVTWSPDFPILNEYQSDNPGTRDAFVTKLNSFNGSNITLAYSTYLGGNDDDWGNGIAVDSLESAYIVGATNSSDFPVKNPIQSDQPDWDIFVTKLNSVGNNVIYSTYLGGNAEDWGKGIAVTLNTGEVYITGDTKSTDFLLQKPYQANLSGSKDAIVAKLNPFRDGSNLELAYSTYLGGNNTDEGKSITIDSTGKAYITGTTNSADFPIKNGCQTGRLNTDIFVTTLEPFINGSKVDLVYSACFGGNGEDIGYGIAVDNNGLAHITGKTSSSNFPVKNSLQSNYGGGKSDSFVTRLGDCQSLTLSPSIIANGAVGAIYNQIFTTSGGTAPYKYEITVGNIPGLSFSMNGVLSGNPTAAGRYSITVKSTDSNCCSISIDYSIRICADCVGVNIAITPSLLPDASINTQYSTQLSASGGTAPYTWTSTGLPAGLKLDSFTGIISGTPTAAAARVSVTVTDYNCCSSSKNYTLIVSSLDLDPPTLPDGFVGVSYAQTISVIGGTAPYLFTRTGLPSWLTISRDGVLSGIPTAAGVFSFRVQAIDGRRNLASRNYTITVKDCSILTLTSGPLANGKIGTFYNQQITASGGIGPYKFSLLAGQLPSNIILLNSGLLSGNLNDGLSQPGIYNFTIEVVDTGTGCKGIKDYSLNIVQ